MNLANSMKLFCRLLTSTNCYSNSPLHHSGVTVLVLFPMRTYSREITENLDWKLWDGYLQTSAHECLPRVRCVTVRPVLQCAARRVYFICSESEEYHHEKDVSETTAVFNPKLLRTGLCVRHLLPWWFNQVKEREPPLWKLRITLNTPP